MGKKPPRRKKAYIPHVIRVHGDHLIDDLVDVIEATGMHPIGDLALSPKDKKEVRRVARAVDDTDWAANTCVNVIARLPDEKIPLTIKMICDMFSDIVEKADGDDDAEDKPMDE